MTQATCSVCGARPPQRTVNDVALCEPCAESLTGDLPLTEHEDGEIPRELDEEDWRAAAVLRQALSGTVGAPPPEDALHAAASGIRQGLKRRHPVYRNIAATAGWRRKPPKDDVSCCVEAAGSHIRFKREPDLTEDEQVLLMAMEHDCLGAVIGLVRAGPGAPVDGNRLVEYLNECPEVETEMGPDDRDLAASAFELILDSWQATGAIDQDRRLTPLGAWVLPRALAWAWSTDFDSGKTRTRYQ